MSHDNARSFETLFKLAGERDLPADAATERARNAAYESWQRMLAERRAAGAPRRGFRIAWAVAAAVSIALVALLFRVQDTGGARVLVARVSAADRGAVLRQRGPLDVRASTLLYSGSQLTTTDGRVALTLGESLSLRVNVNTSVRFDAPDRIALLEGSIYVDSGGLSAGPALRIETPAGELRHVGTQFQVSVDGEHTRVRVREGRVLLAARDARLLQDLAAGDLLEVSGSRTRLDHDLPSFGAEWEWATLVGPSFAIENRPLSEFLTWLAREHGWQLRYADEVLQRRTREIRFHGSLEGQDARAMLERVALITGVPMEIGDGSVLVGDVGAHP